MKAMIMKFFRTGIIMLGMLLSYDAVMAQCSLAEKTLNLVGGTVTWNGNIGSISYCTLAPTGFTLGADHNVIYDLQKDGVYMQSGTGNGPDSQISYGFYGPGTYKVLAYTSPSCKKFMAMYIVVTQLSSPTIFNVSGGGTYCTYNQTGVAVNLSGSSTGVTYYLEIDGVRKTAASPAATAPIAGTGGAISWTVPATTAILYPGNRVKVVAKRNGSKSGDCEQLMNGEATIYYTDPPALISISNPGPACEGTPIVINGTSQFTDYTLLKNGNPVTTKSGPGTLTFADTGPGNYTISALNTISVSPFCKQPMTGTVTIIPKPRKLTVNQSPAAGFVCEGTPVTFSLNDAQNNMLYELKYNGVFRQSNTNYSGDHVSIAFNPETAGGSYQVTAYTTTYPIVCSTPFDPVAIKLYPKPTPSPVWGGGNYCEGEKGVEIGIEKAELGFRYGLYTISGSTPIVELSGWGFPLVFPMMAATGTYVVRGWNPAAPSCTTVDMIGSATITTSPLPNLYTATGENYCTGQTGGFINLSGSEPGIEYQLYRHGLAISSPIIGTGTILHWPDLRADGPYSVVARNPNTGCLRLQTNIITMRFIPVKQFELSGGGTFCNGSIPSITLNGSEAGVNYQLYRNGVSTSNQIAGTGTSIGWGPQTLPGVYTVVATNLKGCSDTMLKSVKIEEGPVVTMNVEKYPCTYYFDSSITSINGCGITSFAWNFGDGATSTAPYVFHSYASNGTYTVTLTVTTTCNGATCTNTVSQPVTVAPFEYEQIQINVPTDTRQKIINTSASTFSDSWILSHNVTMAAKNPFTSGERGVWRNEGQYVYKATRSQSTPVNIASDGTFSMDFFNWQQANVEAIPDWIKATSKTLYSGYSFELENTDVMNVYSSALYDYDGQLMSAEGSNMRNNEMAFSGFESGQSISGNLVMGTTNTQAYKVLAVITGFGHMATVALPGQFANITSADISAFGLKGTSIFSFGHNAIVNDVIVCKTADTSNPANTVLVFNDAPFKESWIGTITVRVPYSPAISATFSETRSHTGKMSLEITAPKNFPQHLLSLDKDKSYVVSTWVSVPGSINATSPVLATNLGLDIIIKDKTGAVNTTFPFQASGPVIEGWQQVTGTFKVPIADSQIEINFRPGSASTAWFDDLRLHPNNGMMKTYVYDLKDYRLTAIMDEQNFASLFYYDDEGNLFLTKKETERGRKTISENATYIKEN